MWLIHDGQRNPEVGLTTCGKLVRESKEKWLGISGHEVTALHSPVTWWTDLCGKVNMQSIFERGSQIWPNMEVVTPPQGGAWCCGVFRGVLMLIVLLWGGDL